MLRFPFDVRGAIAGALIAAMVVGFVIACSGIAWRAERVGLDALLRMSHTHATVRVPATPVIGVSPLIHGGATYQVTGKPVATSQAVAAAGIGILAALTLLVFRIRRIALPVRVIWLLFAAISAATLWYTAWVSPSPPHAPGSLTISFTRSGLMGIVVATLLFAMEVFPVPGPLRVKACWLGSLIAFAFVWGVVRTAVALATVAHVGSWTFLYLQYLTGPFIDFIYIVAFYSFATYSLARHADRRAIA